MSLIVTDASGDVQQFADGAQVTRSRGRVFVRLPDGSSVTFMQGPFAIEARPGVAAQPDGARVGAALHQTS